MTGSVVFTLKQRVTDGQTDRWTELYYQYRALLPLRSRTTLARDKTGSQNTFRNSEQKKQRRPYI